MIQTFTKDNETIDCQVIFKKRKTLGIYIDVYGNVELRVPKQTTEEQILEMVHAKWQWIITRTAEMKEKTKGFKEKEYREGEDFLLLGENLSLCIEEDSTLKKPKVLLEPSNIKIKTPSLDQEILRKAMTRFYKQQCKKIVEQRIRLHQPKFKDKPKSIKISANKKTWGTCNNFREMTFNWRLAMAPLDVIDYVVVHEMCHMVHLNHDRSFWRLVGKYIPQYEDCQEWLKQSHWKMVV